MDNRRGFNKNKESSLTNGHILIASFFIVFLLAAVYLMPIFFPVKYIDTSVENKNAVATTVSPVVEEVGPPKRIVTHVDTPVPLKAIYMTSWVAGTPSMRTNLVKLIDDTELNAVVIDIKDYTGKISFLVDDPSINKEDSAERRIADIKELIDLLHSKNIYVIGRISVFQDSHMVSRHPEWAVRRLSDGGVWKDYKGISWIDVGARPFWDYIIAISKYSYYEIGFDELNFDYIRFPSDGNMKDIKYTFGNEKPKAERLRDFFEYLHRNLKNPHLALSNSNQTEDDYSVINTKDIPVMSADLFGMTTSNYDDLNIGQVLEYAFPYFDYIAPMVYPSHYPANFNGYPNPAAQPYDVIKFSMSRAVERARAASTTPSQLRPWLQDFSIGKTNYTPEMVREQIQATYDVGLDSWMLWNAANRYSASALNPVSIE